MTQPKLQQRSCGQAGGGGETLVAEQRFGQPLAQQGWVCEPARGRLLMFEGDLLHGVLPAYAATERRAKRTPHGSCLTTSILMPRFFAPLRLSRTIWLEPGLWRVWALAQQTQAQRLACGQG